MLLNFQCYMEEQASYELRSRIERIEHHIEKIKKNAEDEDIRKRDMENKINQIHHALIDNPLNANSGYLSRQEKVEQEVKKHSLYFNLIFTLIVLSGALGAFFKFVVHA